MAGIGVGLVPPENPSFVGCFPEVSVTICGKTIPCILDTGSQVTLFSHSLFHRHFGADLVKNPDDFTWLVLKAANGLKIPFVGYAVVDMAVGGIMLPNQGVIVVQDDCMDTECILLGMNVISQCWETIFQTGHPGRHAFRSSLSPFAGRAWERAFAVCKRLQVMYPLAPNAKHRKATPTSPSYHPPKMAMIMWPHVPPTMCSAETPVREWRVARTISYVHGGKVPVRLCNPHPFGITLPQRQALAAVSQIESQEVQATA